MFSIALNNEARSELQSLRASVLKTFVEALKSMMKISKYELIMQDMPTNPRFKDQTGLRYGKLVVKEYLGKKGQRQCWKCICDCGQHTVTDSNSLTTGNTGSCGCLRAPHHDSNSALHKAWKGLKGRCSNPDDPAYANYGARGITIADEFKDYAAFKSYIDAELGPRPSLGHSLDRIANEAGYIPGNLRWATAKEQARNRRSTWLTTLCGQAMAVAEACEIFGLPYRLVRERVKRQGWTLAKALTEPISKVKNPPRGAPPN